MAGQGFAEQGGARQEDAWELWAKAGLDDGFQHAWLLADVNQDGFLSDQVRANGAGALSPSMLPCSAQTATARCARSCQHGLQDGMRSRKCSSRAL